MAPHPAPLAVTLAVTLLAGAGCQRGSEGKTPVRSPSTSVGDPSGGPTSPGEPVAAAKPLQPQTSAELPKGAVVAVSKLGVKPTPDEKAKTTTVLGYGERVTLLSVADGGEAFAHVKLSDGTEGYLPARHLMLHGGMEATLVTPQDLYARPDPFSPFKKRAEAGVLLFVIVDRDGWRQVQLPDRTQGWLTRDKATTEPAEVAAATALYKIDTLIEQKRQDAAIALLQDYLKANAGARLAPLVEARLQTLLPPDGGPAAAAIPPAAGVDGGPAPAAAGTPAPATADPAPAPAPGGGAATPPAAQPSP